MLGNGKTEEVDGDFVGRSVEHQGHDEMREHAWWNTVTILFPYHSILLIIHSHCFLTWRGSVRFLNTAYFLVHSLSTFSLVSLSLDVPIS